MSVDAYKKVFQEETKTKTPRKFSYVRQWVDVGDNLFFCKSDWELRFAKHLQFLKETNLIQEWRYEPETFWFLQIKRGIRSYKPDFKVTENDGTHYWVEVKGFMDKKSQTKIKRFKKYYPKERLLIIDEEWFKKNVGYGKES